MILRDYQSAAVQSVWDYLEEKEGNPVVVIPTGGGKTPVLATLASHAVREWQGRVLIISHVKELLEQSADKLSAIAPDISFGVYSAGLGRSDTEHDVIIGGIQSMANAGAAAFGRRDLIIVDESHLVPNGGDGRYQTFLREAKLATNHVRLIGLTATPYRTTTGKIYGKGCLFSDVCHETTVLELIEQGYLCTLITPLISKNLAADLSSVKKKAGEFVEGDLQRAMMRGHLVSNTVDDIVSKSHGRNSVLIFACGIAHAQAIFEELKTRGESAEIITGEASPFERSWTINSFRNKSLRFLVNVNVLTIGFDAPAIDCVCLVRPTCSAGLYYQMVGRGFRIHESKKDCMVLDYGGNIARHGPVDAIKVKPRPENGEPPQPKVCEKCGEECHASCKTCPSCGESFQKPCWNCDVPYDISEDKCPSCNEPRKQENVTQPETQADESSAILSTQIQITTETMAIGDIAYSKHIRRKLKPRETFVNPTLKVEYFAPGSQSFVRTPIAVEYICIEHEGFAYSKALAWWAKRSNDPFPLTVDQAVGIANHGGVAACTEITVRTDPNKSFPEITNYKLEPKPQLEHDPSVKAEDLSFLDELPF